MKVCLAMCLLLSASAWAEVETSKFKFKEGGLLKVRSTSGDVKVRKGKSSEIIVKADKIKFGKDCKLEFDKKGDSELLVRVENKGSGWFSSSCKIKLDITVPEKITQDIKSGSGDIEINDTLGDISIKVGSGDINVKARSMNLVGKTGSGDISLEGSVDKTQIRSGSGDINATITGVASKGGYFDVKTGSGDVLLKLPKKSKVKTEFRSGSGSVKNEFGSVSDANFTVEVKTGSGDLKILKI